ncbi:bifunctional phosphopantothenoylcysteine decarboxylase/phosphopantothenate--cysteine ligase CoaBC [Pleomorphovibrio marinus]|uniref:bifunctional phosphopantothenoylcysteine decarboxylase/phosphopantothenate--cysteine ligase CoaBC n=1 Tax=Pleomorphovibrio marinus TaxID=2164132 RepID=UPI000E0A00E3|nr:bifunctional phosphopantothenoylcysteine decarboxylase/phosphopantothenate--cysteine ligase CoaBC [Pleomorphovibrio marinus]
MSLKGKKILLGITGGIAAYKCASLIRLLVKQGAEVKVIMTTSALDFITPLTLATLSKNPVLHDFYDKGTGEWTNHVSLGLWADLMIIAPLSANTLSKMANGQSDNLLLTTYLSARCPVMVAPAMDLDMYKHPSVRTNLDRLEEYQVIVLEAGTGDLASGLSGKGRMLEPEEILEAALNHFDNPQTLEGRTFLITAGPTQEAIDPVRYISNHSSGKMGIALADTAAALGAKVTLILGPSSLSPTHPGIEVVAVTSAKEMYDAAALRHPIADVIIFAAAVADYTPVTTSSEKLKKSGSEMNIPLKKNIDIAETLGKSKGEGQFHIGFALETENEEANAKEKLERKNFDLVVLNSLRDEGAGFRHDTNKVTLIKRGGSPIQTEVMSKTDVAKRILNEIPRSKA